MKEADKNCVVTISVGSSTSKFVLYGQGNKLIAKIACQVLDNTSKN